ncbi:RelA/SpoT domain-containing protein [Stenotrophomonas maltophilia]|uniref:RelA/SpoT domain-containing protein n=1 Tax=Stenotrophomonas maltophilia TaxID=40324 RepID=UPI00115CA3B7|nr:RelA/SpoT domain-containing protein [Stenotrophomonas maltophilia]
MNGALDVVAERIRRQVEGDVLSIGLLARVFARGKSKSSLKRKLDREPGKYSVGGRLIQDGVGVRVALYFPDDVSIVEDLLKRKYEYLPDSSSIDNIDESTFNVVRRNLVFRMKQEDCVELERGGFADVPLDTTFEVQLRSMLSEGWHEVEHDLRYKCKTHWHGHSDLNRALNGVFATLETSEWSMLKIFDDLALRHYRSGQWAAMAHARFRIRADAEMLLPMAQYFDWKDGASKALFRADRRLLFSKLSSYRIAMPVTISNFVFLWNHVVYKCPELAGLAPSPIQDALSEIDDEVAA